MTFGASAIAWEFRRRHRWGFIAIGAYLVVIAAIKLVIVLRGLRVVYHDGETFGFVIMGPLAATFTYFLAVFTYGLSGDLAARESMYPARRFTLPISTAALAGWPMLYGGAATAGLWIATRLFAPWPSDTAVPWLWPAFLAAALVAWTQALTWMPYGFWGLRVLVSVLWLGAIDTIALLAISYKVSEPVMLAIAIPQIPLAFVVARFAVARARQGIVPDWRPLAGGRPAPRGTATQHNRFASADAAQAWFEWRSHGLTLPAMVAILLPFELLTLAAAGETGSLVAEILGGVLLTPPVMAAFAAAAIRKGGASEDSGLPAFLATRPLTSPALIAAKLKMTLWSMLVTWALVLVAIPIGLKLTGTWPLAAQRIASWRDTLGTPRLIVAGLLIILGFMAATWKQLVQTLYVGLTGREWLVNLSVFLALVFLSFLGPTVDWIAEHRRAEGFLWDALPVILGVLAVLKILGAGWVAVRLYDSRLFQGRTLVIGAAGWCGAVLALYAVFLWFFDSPFYAHYISLLIAILFIPLVRLSASPLALAWNRHR